MAEYASLRKIEFELCGGNLPEKYKAFVRRVLNDRNLIPAADVAPVVRCKGCKHSWEDIGGLCCGYGPLVDSIVPEDFFCAYGKPKEGAHADDHD